MISELSGEGGETKVSIWVKLPTMNRRLTKVSKYLSFVLRHHPEAIGLKLDPERWANVDELLQNAKAIMYPPFILKCAVSLLKQFISGRPFIASFNAFTAGITDTLCF